LTPRAVSRFKGPPFFTDQLDENYMLYGDSKKVELKSSARPPASDIIYAVPSFRWRTELSDNPARFTNRRYGAGLRIYFRRPFLCSGEDELLGVVVAQTPEVLEAIQNVEPQPVPISNDTPEKVAPFVSSSGSDSIWKLNPCRSAPIGLVDWWTRLPDSAKKDADAAANTLDQAAGACGWDLRPLEFEQAGLPDNTKVAVVGFAPQLDLNRNLWYCDIYFNSAPEYGTWVRLAVGSYQPHSVSQCELSPLKMLDFAQLNPDRAVAVQRAKGPHGEERLQVSVFGVSNPGGLDGVPNQVEVTLQKRAYKDEKLGWRELTAAEMARQVFPNAGPFPSSTGPGCESLLWSGQIAPDPLCADRRLLIAEYEKFKQDDAASPDGKPGSRLVYMDAIPIK
jgi:hypothetical protein